MATDVNPYDALRRIEALAKVSTDPLGDARTIGTIYAIAICALLFEPKPSSLLSEELEDAA